MSNAPSVTSPRSGDSTFSIELGPDLGPSVSTDPKRVQQVLRNLLSNAFKFTEQGSVTLRVQKRRQVGPAATRA